MLLTNWLNTLTSRISKRRVFRSRDRRDIRKRWQSIVHNQISTTEALEDRTLLTTFFVDDSLVITNDPGADGLNAGDTVTFASGEAGETTGLIFGTDVFDTIQDAVTAAASSGDLSDIINIAAGTYNENVTVGTAIEFIGAGTANTFVGGTGNLFTVTANNVSFQDMTLQNATQGIRVDLLDGTVDNLQVDNVHFIDIGSYGIEVHNGTTLTNLDVANSLFRGTASVGIRFAQSAIGDGVDIDNTEFDGLGRAIYQQSHSATGLGYLADLQLTYSTIHNMSSEGIYTEELTGDNITGTNISNNIFEDNSRDIILNNKYGTSGTAFGNIFITDNTFTDSEKLSIQLNSKGTSLEAGVTITGNTFNSAIESLIQNWGQIDVSLQSGISHAPVVINENTINFTGSSSGGATEAYGIRLMGASDDITINGNTLTDTNTGGVQTSALFVDTNNADMGPVSSTAIINATNNFISGFDSAVSVFATSGPMSGPGGLVPGAQLNINNNSITNNAIGVLNGPGATVNASGNWWGTSDEGVIAGLMTVGVDFSSYLNSDTDTDGGTAGFQGDFSVVNVTALGAQTGPVGRIQEAIDLATSGATINVAAGTYAEDVIVNTSVTIQGANAGIAAGVDPGARGLESELTGGFRLFANDVVIDGLKIVEGTGPAGVGSKSAVFMANGTTGHTIENNILEGPGTGVESRGVLSTFNGNNDNITIQNNEIYDWVAGIHNHGNTNVDIFGNNIHSVFVGVANDYVADVTIEGNAFSNSTEGIGVLNNISNGTPDVAAHNNSFDSLTLTNLIAHYGGDTVDASGNWWGIIDATTIANSMMSDGVVGDASKVDFTSYLDNGVDTVGGTAGFQGDFSVVNVTTLGEQTGLTGRIQEAIDSVAYGATINILAGTYTGNVDATGINITLAPGNSPGQVVINGDLILNGDDTLDIEINGTTAGSGYDQFIVNGAVVLNDAVLNLSSTYTPVDGDKFTLIDNDAADGITGTFIGFPEGHNFTNFLGSGLNAYLTYVGGDGNDVVIHMVDSTPEVDLPDDDGPDNYSLTIVGGNVVITDVNTGGIISSTPLASLAGTLVINGEDGENDTLSIDMTGIDHTTPLQIQFNGGTGGFDTLELLGGSLNSVEHIFTSDSSGSVQLNGSGTDFIRYTGLEPVLDTIVAGDRTFSFTGAAEIITLSDDGVAANGTSRIDSNIFGEVVTFLNPTDNIFINTELSGGSGADLVDIVGLDSNFDANLTVTAGTDDTIDTGTVDIGSGILNLTGGQVNVNGAFTTTGSVDIDANAADITFGVVGSIDAGTSEIDLTATFNVESVKVTTTSEVRVTATGGGINNVNTTLITADRVALVADGAGGGISGVNTDVNTLAARAAGGGFTIDNAGDLEIGAVGVLIGVNSGINADNSTVFLTTTGQLTVTNAVSAGTIGHLRAIDAAGAGQDLNVNAGVTTTSGNLNLDAGDNLNLATGVTLNAAADLILNIDSPFGGVPDAAGGVANLNGILIAGTDITVNGGAEADQVIIDSNGGPSNDGGTVDGIQSLFTFLGGGGNDELIVDDSGDATGDNIIIQNTGDGVGTVIGAGAVTLSYEDLEDLTFYSGSDADDITVNPNISTTINIFGGDPAAPTMPADSLTYLTPGGQISTLSPSGLDGGTIGATGGFQDVVFDEIESLTFGGSVAVTGTAGDDILTISATSANAGTYRINGGPIINLDNITDFTFNGGDGNDTLIIDNSGITPTGGSDLFDPTDGIFFNGEGNLGVGVGDRLQILGGDATTVEHRFTNANDGFVFYDGEGTATITYTGLEPVLDTIAATNRIFSFTGAGETITLSDDGDANDDESLIGSTLGELVTFDHSTLSTVTIITTAGSGVDSVEIEGVDANFDANLIVTAGTDDTVIFQAAATDLGSGDLTVNSGNVVFDADVTTTGNAVINATGGSITDGGSSAADELTAATAVLTATVDVGGAGDAVDINVDNLEADADGAINVVNTSGATLTIGGIAGSLIDGLEAVTGISLTTDADLENSENVTSTGAGLVELISAGGSITMGTGTTFDAGTGALEVTADNNVQLELLTTSTADVTVTATNGAITDGNAGGNNISAVNATLNAGTGAGVGNALETTITALEANTGAGLEVDDAATLNIGFTGGIVGLTVGAPSRITSSGTMTVTEGIAASGGNLQLENTVNDFVLNAATTISNTGGFSIQVDSANDLTVNGTVQTAAGAITLRADNDLILGATSLIDTTAAAVVTLTADAAGPVGGVFTQNEGGVVNAYGGDLNVAATGDIRLADLQSAGGTITVDSAAGAILDNTAAGNNLITADSVYLEAATSIGIGDDIDTAVTTLAARAFDGEISVRNSGDLTIGTVGAFPAGVIATSTIPANGTVTIIAASPLTVASNVSGSGTVTLTSTDVGGLLDVMTINAGVTVESTGDNVILNSGDDFTLALTGTVRAATTIEINVDPSAGDPDAAGAIVNLLGNVDATLTTINGGDDNDIFNILPTGTSPITVNGGSPALPTIPGDTLNIDLTGLTSPVLTLGGSAGSGTFSFNPDPRQAVTYNSIEDVNSIGVTYHLVLDMAASGFENGGNDTIDAGLDAGGTNLVLDINTNNFFTGDDADIRSFTVLGSTDNDTLNINETAGGLPLFVTAAPAGPVIPGSNGAHLNSSAETFLNTTLAGAAPFTVTDITIHYDGGAGTDAINVNFITDHNTGYFADTVDGLGSGNIASAAIAGADIDLGLSFARLEGVGLFGTATGGLRVDASSTPDTNSIAINDDGTAADGISQITGNMQFTNVLFDGFNDLQVVSGTGAELLDLIGLDENTTLSNVELDADNVDGTDTANDTIRVRSTPVTTVTNVTLLGGAGNDLFQIFDAGNTVDNINAAIQVFGEDGVVGTDTLTLIDSGDVTGDTFEVTSTTIQDLISSPVLDVTFTDIDNLNVTGTGGNDTINVNLGAQLDLNNVNINGSGGDDDFNLQNSTPVGVDTRLNGNAGLDEFFFLGTNVLRGFINGGSEVDTIDYNGYTPPVHVALSNTGTIDGFEGRELNGSILGTGVASLAFDNIDNLVGTLSNDDVLEGPDLNNYWGITSTDEGFIIADRANLNSGRPTIGADATASGAEERLDFTDFQNLIGGTQDDRFDLTDGAGLTGNLDGDSGNDSLDYRDFSTGVTVNLFAGTATNIGGDLEAGAGGGDDDNSIENVFGGDGNDNITGDNDNNILGDGLGSDNLDGGGFGVGGGVGAVGVSGIIGSGNGGNDVFLMEPGAGGSADVITDIHGNDTIDFRFASTGITFDVDLLNVAQTVFGSSTVTLQQIIPEQPVTNPSFMENIVGSQGDDTIFIDPLSQDGNFPIDGPPVLRSADGLGGTDFLDFDSKGQEVIDTGFSLTADGVGTVQYLNFENVTPFEDNPAFIVDNGDPGFTFTGDWPWYTLGNTSLTNGIGFEDDIYVAHPQTPFSTGPAQAYWEFFGLTPGEYRISVTWPATTSPSNVPLGATDAPYTIYDGSRTEIGSTALDLGTTDLNQQLAPDDYSADGTTWEILDTVTISSRTLTVMLTNLADGGITADAIRIERVSAGPEIELVDVTDALAPPALIVDGHPDGIKFGPTELLTDAVRTFEITNNGSADLNISNISVPAGYTTSLTPQVVGIGNTISFTITMGSDTFGDRSGIFSFDTDDVDEATFNILLDGQVSNVVIIDDGDVGEFTATGTFTNYSTADNGGSRGYEGDVTAAIPNAPGSTTPPAGTDTATWTFTGLAEGNYRVSTTWSQYYNRVTDAPFSLDGGAGTADIVVDQSVAPSSFIENGTSWFDLSTSFAVDATGELVVTLTNEASNFIRDHFTLANGVIADAIRIEYLPEPDLEVTYDLGSGPIVVDDDTGVVDFGSTIPGIPVIIEFTVTNLSADPVNVTGLIEFPPGFSIIPTPTTQFGTNTTPVSIAGGGSETFQIQFDGGTNGTTFGQVSFTTGDVDENPYNFTVRGEAGPATIGINDTDFTQVGTWNGYTPGNAGDPLFLTGNTQYVGGDGSSTATWDFDVEPGRYQVVAHWNVSPDFSMNGAGAATNAPYTIFGGSVPVTVLKSHQTSANDFLDDGLNWEYIGDPVVITGNSLSVQLSNLADGVVYADEVRIYRVVDPVIKVEVDGGTVEDSGSVEFDDTIVGAPVFKTFTVTNYGERDMALGPISPLPTGFSLASPFGTNNLPPGASTTFTLRMDAGSAGSFSGMVTFAVDSSDANPFNFMVSGSAAGSMIIDNGDLGYSTSGDWLERSATSIYDYYENDQDELYGGDQVGTNTASWEFTNLAAGTYNLSSHWAAHSSLATNAQFVISGILGGDITVTLNQRFAANDFVDGSGVNWETLGDFQVAGGTLTITLLDDGANGHLAADAMRLAVLSSGSIAPEIEVQAGAVNLVDGVSSIDLGTTFYGESLFQTFTITNTGTDTLNLSAVIPPAAAGYSISTPLGTTTLFVGQSTTFEVEFNNTTLAGGLFSGTLTIPNNDSDESPFTIDLSATMTTAQIVDDGDAGFSTTGGFYSTSWLTYFQGDTQQLNTGANGTATWDFSSLPAGTYNVYASWSAHPSLATNAEYSINAGGPITINQGIAPNDLTSDGTNWELLGTVSVLAGGSVSVELTDNAADGRIRADAIRIERTGPLMAAAGVSSTNAPAITQSDLDSVRDAALNYWKATGLSETQISLLESVNFVLTDLPDAMLGAATTTTILIDVNAAGYGWFVDNTPFDSSEFSLNADGDLIAGAGSAAFGQMDLLTVMLHEMGHALGHDHADDHDSLMSDALDASERHLPEIDDFFSGVADGDNPLLD
ncbi:choice-of-anchor D domain-containing protein [Gimesia sp.]|uniref:golvesin C-terminal-like domain-containing protein n=1 Tax=Gimesia sp. TaxID=2024833 RepID=UPI003A8CE1D3